MCPRSLKTKYCQNTRNENKKAKQKQVYIKMKPQKQQH